MARNKYPEETVQKILDVSLRLFKEKGFEKTSIQDIVDRLGMSKGAIYHHFKNKEEILDRLSDVIYGDLNWLEDIRQSTSLNGLQKLQKLFAFQLSNDEKISMDVLSAPVVNDSHLLVEMLKSSLHEVAPILQEFIQEGQQDGSIKTAHPREVSEVMILLINVWLNPFLISVKRDYFMDKVLFYRELLAGMGISLFDDEILEIAGSYYDKVNAQIQ